VDQDIIFILEIQVDGSVGNPRLFGNLGNCRLEKALLGKDLNCRFQNTIVFIVIFACLVNSNLPTVKNLELET
jgi:hypothetical protein